VQADPLRTRVHNLERFVTVKGGAYFFLPSISALRYLAALQTLSIECKQTVGLQVSGCCQEAIQLGNTRLLKNLTATLHIDTSQTQQLN
jgi:hypothetical protein